VDNRSPIRRSYHRSRIKPPPATTEEQVRMKEKKKGKRKDVPPL
jgi:hypothetical protein